MLVFRLMVLWLCFFTPAMATLGNPSILFILHASSETRAFEAVMKILDKEKANYAIVALGTAEQLLKDHPKVLDIRERCDFRTHIDDKNWESCQRISEADVTRLANCIKPQVVVTGMFSRVQVQLSQAFSRKHTKVIGFFDSFNSARYNPEARLLADYTNLIILPEPSLAREFRGSRGKTSSIKVMGHPLVDLWHREVIPTKRETARKNLGIENTKKDVVLYVGGYGDAYDLSFEMFVQSMPFLKDKDILIALHPRVDGSTERAILSMHRATNYQIVPRKFPLVQAACAADYIICQRSSIGVQAFFSGIPVIYLDARPESYKNVLIEKGMSPQVSTPESLIVALQGLKYTQNNYREMAESSGIPLGAPEKIAREIMAFLPEATSTQGLLYR